MNHQLLDLCKLITKKLEIPGNIKIIFSEPGLFMVERELYLKLSYLIEVIIKHHAYLQGGTF